MKKQKPIDEPLLKLPLDEEPQEEVEDDSFADQADVYSIQEFIERKKLQNEILRKMLEKMNHNENENNQ